MNIETIARLSGVSRSTVSRVINRSPNVSAEVRERVMRVIQETNFQPNFAARSLASGSTRVIALVIPVGVGQIFVDPYFPLLIQGITSACSAIDYAVMLWLAEPEYERRTARQLLYSGLIDGVIISSLQMEDALVNAMIERNFPFVMVGRPFSEKAVYYVDVDNVGSSCLAVNHLLSQGRRRIAAVTGVMSMVSGVDRLRGYRMALEQSGVSYCSELVVSGEFTQEGAYHAAQQLLTQHPDAVFAASDVMAQGVYRAVTEAGLTIPADVAVVGYDDLPFAAQMQPPLTTVRQPVQRLGASAVDNLINLLNGSAAIQPGCVLLPTELVVRGSCGAVQV